MHPRLLFSGFFTIDIPFLIIILYTGSQCRLKLNLTLWSKRISLCIPIPEWDVKWQMSRAILKMCKEEAMSSVKSDKSFGLSDKKRVLQEGRQMEHNGTCLKHTKKPHRAMIFQMMQMFFFFWIPAGVFNVESNCWSAPLRLSRWLHL